MKLKEQIIALGASEELAQKIIDEIMDGQFVPKSRFNEVNEENKTLKKTVSERDGQLEELKKSSGDMEELKRQITNLQTENADNKVKYEADMRNLRLDNAVKAALTNSKAKNAAVVAPLLAEFLKTAEIDEKGSVKGLDKEIEKLKADVNSSFLFESEQETAPRFKGMEPQSGQTVGKGISSGAMYAQKYNAQFVTNKKE